MSPDCCYLLRGSTLVCCIARLVASYLHLKLDLTITLELQISILLATNVASKYCIGLLSTTTVVSAPRSTYSDEYAAYKNRFFECFHFHSGPVQMRVPRIDGISIGMGQIYLRIAASIPQQECTRMTNDN